MPSRLPRGANHTPTARRTDSDPSHAGRPREFIEIERQNAVDLKRRLSNIAPELQRVLKKKRYGHGLKNLTREKSRSN
jgi:hypothetical protein